MIRLSNMVGIEVSARTAGCPSCTASLVRTANPVESWDHGGNLVFVLHEKKKKEENPYAIF